MAAAVTAAAIGTVLPAAAQDVTGPRPFSGVFGGSSSDPSQTHTLSGSIAVAAGYDHNVRDDSSPEVSVFERTGSYQVLAGSLNYALRTGAVQWGATAGTNLRYLNVTEEIVRINDYAGVGVAAQLGRRWSVSGNQGIACGPLHFQGLFPVSGDPILGAAPAIGVDYSLDRERACSHQSAATVGLGLGARTSIQVFGGLSRTMFAPESGYETVQSGSTGAQLSHNISRRARVRVRYARRFGDYWQFGRDSTGTLHDIDAGIDYDRPLSLTRRTYFDFRVTSTAVSTPDADGQRTQYRIGGDAGLNHEFGQTWRARAGYNRGVEFVHGLAGPVFFDGFNASLNGFLSRRVDFTANLTATSGHVQAADVPDAESAVTAYSASTRANFALARAWALFGDYTYYSQELPPAALTYAVPPSLDRHSARVGLTWWIPIIGR